MKSSRDAADKNKEEKNHVYWLVNAETSGRIALREFLHENEIALSDQATNDPSPYQQLKAITDDKKLLETASHLLSIPAGGNLTPRQIILLRSIRNENILKKEERHSSVALRKEALINEISVFEEEEKIAADAKWDDVIESLKTKAQNAESADLDLLAMFSNPKNKKGIITLLKNYETELKHKNLNSANFANDFYGKIREMYNRFKNNFIAKLRKNAMSADTLYMHVEHHPLFRERLFIESHKTLQANQEQKKETKVDFQSGTEWNYVKPRVGLYKLLLEVGLSKTKQEYHDKIAFLGLVPKGKLQNLNIAQAKLVDELFAESIYIDILSNLKLMQKAVFKFSPNPVAGKKILQGIPRPVLFGIFSISKLQLLEKFKSENKIIPTNEEIHNSVIGTLGNDFLSQAELKNELKAWNLTNTDEIVQHLFTENQYAWLLKQVETDNDLLNIVEQHKSEFEKLFSKQSSHEKIMSLFTNNDKNDEKNYEINKKLIGVKNFSKGQYKKLATLVRANEAKDLNEAKNAISSGLSTLLSYDQIKVRPQLQRILAYAQTQIDNLYQNAEIRNRKRIANPQNLEIIYKSLNKADALQSTNISEVQKFLKYVGLPDKVGNEMVKALINENKFEALVDEVLKKENNAEIARAKEAKEKPKDINGTQIKQKIIHATKEELATLLDTKRISEIYAQVRLYEAYSMAGAQNKLDRIANNEPILLQVFKEGKLPEDKIIHALENLIRTGNSEQFDLKEEKIDRTYLNIVNSDIVDEARPDDNAMPEVKILTNEYKIIENYSNVERELSAATVFPALNKVYEVYPEVQKALDAIIKSNPPEVFNNLDNKKKFYDGLNKWINDIKFENISSEKRDVLQDRFKQIFKNLGLELHFDAFNPMYKGVLLNKGINNNVNHIKDRLDYYKRFQGIDTPIDNKLQQDIIQKIKEDVTQLIDAKSVGTKENFNNILKQAIESYFLQTDLKKIINPMNTPVDVEEIKIEIKQDAVNQPIISVNDVNDYFKPVPGSYGYVAPDNNDSNQSKDALNRQMELKKAELEEKKKLDDVILQREQSYNEFNSALNQITNKNSPPHLKLAVQAILKEGANFFSNSNNAFRC